MNTCTARRWAVNLIVGMALAPAVARADFEWNYVHTEGVLVGDPSAKATVRRERGRIVDNLVKVVENEGRDWRIYNLDSQRVWLVHFDRPGANTGVVTEMSFSDMRGILMRNDAARMEKLGAAETEARSDAPMAAARTQRLVAAQRQFLSFGGGPFTHKPQSLTRTIHGYTCALVDAYEGERLFTRIWVTSDITPPPEYQQFVEALAAIDPRRHGAVQGLTGMPVLLTINLGEVANTTELESVSTQSISPTEFILPPTLTPVSVRELQETGN